jgi:hypothetical protein
MTSNSVFKKMQNFISEEMDFSTFERILKRETSFANPMRVGWITETGRKRYYDMYWVPGPLSEARTPARKASNTKRRMDMYNIQVKGIDGEWRTIDFNTVYKVRWDNKTYRVNN